MSPYSAAPIAVAAPVRLCIDSHLHVPGDAPAELHAALRGQFTIPNPEYQEAVKYDRSTRDLATHLRYYTTTGDGDLVLPRGALEVVYRQCQEYEVPVVWDDHTHTVATVPFTEHLPLSVAQEQAVAQVLRRRMGTLQAPAGAGKTTMAMAVIARRGQPALFLVHTTELAAQALRTAQKVLGLAPSEVGMIGGGKATIGERLTIALVQSLQREVPAELREHVGHIILDEAHHAPAETFAAVVSQFPARFLTGLTATPFRRDGLNQAIGWYLGPVVAQMDASDLRDRLIKPRVIKRETGIRPRGDSFTQLVSRLTTTADRNALIVGDVAAEVARGRQCLVLSDRVEHVEALAALLSERGLAAEALHGQQRKRAREQVVARAQAGEITVVVATCSLIGEGFDCPPLSALYLTTPVSFEARTIQYIGRVSRTAPGKRDAVVYDYCDDHPMLWASWRQRSDVYRTQSLARSTLPAPRREAAS